MARPKGGLGKGLEALFADNDTGSENITTMRISEIEPNREQPRRFFDQDAIVELAESIREHGLIQPIVVKPMIGGNYQIVAGERRWRASRMAGLSEVPVVIRDISEQEAMELALIENLQREDLNPVEEAKGFAALMEQYGLTQEQTADRVGKSRSAVANTLRLLQLPEKIQQYLLEGTLSAGHGRALLALPDDEKKLELAERAAAGEITVREIERIARREKKPEKKDVLLKKEAVYYKEMELALCEQLGRRVTVRGNAAGKGSLEIDFYSREELEQMAKKLLEKEG